MEHFCENVGHTSGGYAEYATFHKTAVYKLPDDVSLEKAALLEPLAVAVHAIDLSNIRVGSSVAILGGGPIGLILLQLAIRSGAAKTLVSEPVNGKRKVAEALGADMTVDPLHGHLEEIGQKLTGSRGFDTVIEMSGHMEVARQALLMAGKCGTVIWASVYPTDGEIAVPPAHIQRNELTIRSVFISPYTYPRALALLPKIETQSLITNIFSLEDIGKAFDVQKRGNAIKILIRM
jgi:(R,R)-butanediol dehydrogenase/meso-butanediol dehydrogenase/diacetyl reductase/L-iditol 2-dehydrogenase